MIALRSTTGNRRGRARTEQLHPLAPRVDDSVLLPLAQGTAGGAADGLNYRDLDEIPAFQGINTSAEAVAR
ncbi:MAG TPA: hypothetical protein VNL16_15290 [Chloroflexota bacterium]|nr:hypothetical protein [Chloroflexota bacterium]